MCANIMLFSRRELWGVIGAQAWNMMDNKKEKMSAMYVCNIIPKCLIQVGSSLEFKLHLSIFILFCRDLWMYIQDIFYYCIKNWSCYTWQITWHKIHNQILRTMVKFGNPLQMDCLKKSNKIKALTYLHYNSKVWS